MPWKPGDRLTHRFNPELGTGIVREVDERSVVVEFPDGGTVLRLAATSDAIRPLELRPGSPVTVGRAGARAVVDELLDDGTARLDDGREVAVSELWPVDLGEELFERLALGHVGRLDEFSVRLESLHLARLREASGLGSFLGGRIRLFPHQLHVAERATRSDPVRWLLADEVGLGKTVEACLVLNHLLRTGRADRTLVVAPASLTVQWLGELWRKYHQVFVLLDAQRLADVRRDFGPGFNPFETHRRAVVALELLVAEPHLAVRAAEAGIDLLIVDEAHRLRRPPGHPGDPAYRAVRTVSDLGRHVLLLTATPLEDDVHGFFRLLQLLRPEEFPEETDFAARLAQGAPLPPCTSATRRADIGGLPPRAGRRIDLDAEAWAPIARLEAALRLEPAPHAAARRQKARRLRRALASGAALEALLDPRDAESRRLAREAAAADPRLEWLAEQGEAWRRAGDKTLVFVAHRETLELVRETMSRRVQLRVGVFHEDLSPAQRDIEVAQFRLSGGPSMLVSTECGGEGRNFEFCTRLVLFDLPWNPMAVEQRIGRLDRIGRRIPVEIVWFHPPAGLGAAVADLFVQLGLFEHPVSGLERELARVEAAIEDLALGEADLDGATNFAEIVDETRHADDRVRAAAYHELHREPYRPELAQAILSRVPEDLDELNESVILGACERLGFDAEPHRDGARWSIAFGSRARVDSLPEVQAGASFLGTFRRERAVEDEGIDFFAAGHPLVEGLLAHLDESPLGRVGLLEVAGEVDDGLGLLALYRTGTGFEAVALDTLGRPRPDWAERLVGLPLRSRRVRAEGWTAQPGWPEWVRGLARRLEDRGRPAAVAAFRIVGQGRSRRRSEERR